jgi:hypothetical protein
MKKCMTKRCSDTEEENLFSLLSEKIQFVSYHDMHYTCEMEGYAEGMSNKLWWRLGI